MWTHRYPCTWPWLWKQGIKLNSGWDRQKNNVTMFVFKSSVLGLQTRVCWYVHSAMIHKMQNNLMRVATEMGLSNLFNMDIICDDSVTGGSNWVKCLLASGLYLYLGMSVPISSYKDMNTCPNRYTPMFGDTTRHLPARIKTHLFTRHHIYHVTSAPCLYFFSHICHSMASNRLGHRHHMWPCDACGNKMMLCTRGKKKAIPLITIALLTASLRRRNYNIDVETEHLSRSIYHNLNTLQPCCKCTLPCIYYIGALKC